MNIELKDIPDIDRLSELARDGRLPLDVVITKTAEGLAKRIEAYLRDKARRHYGSDFQLHESAS